jgi:hypothetical protein
MDWHVWTSGAITIPIAGTYFENDNPFELARLLGKRIASASLRIPGS